MQNISQRDSQWANIKLGTGSTNTSTIGSHGCTISCVAMLAGLTPDVVNEKLISVNGYAADKSTPNTFNLIIWSKINQAIPWLKHEWRSYVYDNDKVKEAIDKNGGCLVEVSGARIGGYRHWVLFIGNGQMIDPWTGAIKATSWYGTPLGYSTIAVTSQNTGNEPSDALTECLKQHDDLVTKCNQKDSLISELQETIKSKDKTIAELKQEHQNYLDGLAKVLWEDGEPTLSDEKSIREKIESLRSLKLKNDELLLDLENSKEEQKKAQISYEERLKKLNNDMELMKEDYERKITNIQAQVNTEIENLNKLKEKYETTNRFIKWIKEFLKW